MSIRIRIHDGTASLSHSRSDAESTVIRTAMIEARGALLHWDAASDARFPDAEIHSPVEAAGWLADIYGHDIAAAIDVGDDIALPLPDHAGLVDATHHLAVLTWARDWWPAGIRTPALSVPVLAAEIAVAVHAVEHLLDDEDAVERALRDAADAATALAAVPQALRAEAAALLHALAELAEDHAVELRPAASAASQDWALAAGARIPVGAGIEIGHGTAPVRWSDVPAQTVAADSDAQWSLRHVDGVPHLQVTVVAVPGVGVPGAPARLRARFGPESLRIDLPLRGDGDAFTGSIPVVASVALLPLDQRILWVRDPVLAPTPGPAEIEADRDAVRAHAVRRLADPAASIAERMAGE
ncbi:uncharacterized protein (UPF0147 family) [Microbacterium sp. W4I4]|uniref:hypothetical protein n=1 Tax=Microbacterium sp. W4I4 TaxID=3042295 RepID=UPI00278B6299|nr:hypothetical protein [Microbacterium sp. W4I4]MDQ0615474.1 uncharacterized protein (UPF0147 family) [Microbacterium sp. W4I4]